jgi:hypothetical protein
VAPPASRARVAGAASAGCAGKVLPDTVFADAGACFCAGRFAFVVAFAFVAAAFVFVAGAFVFVAVAFGFVACAFVRAPSTPAEITRPEVTNAASMCGCERA